MMSFITEDAGKYLLRWGVRLLGVVAFLAAGDAIPTSGLAAASDWNHVVHRKVVGPYMAMAIVALTSRKLRAPPVGITQFPRLDALTLHVLRVWIQVKPLVVHARMPLSVRHPPPGRLAGDRHEP